MVVKLVISMDHVPVHGLQTAELTSQPAVWNAGYNWTACFSACAATLSFIVVRISLLFLLMLGVWSSVLLDDCVFAEVQMSTTNQLNIEGCIPVLILYECYEAVHLTMQFRLPNLRWQSIWGECGITSFSKEMNWKIQYSFNMFVLYKQV